jgi:hypothetical protein
MVILRTLLFAHLAACYSPDLRDCAVTCNQAADCAPGQVCGSDGFCAAEDVAGRCASIAAPNDAGALHFDARPDAPDAWLTVRVWVRIEGRGVVSIPTVGTCDGSNGQTECMFDVAHSVPLALHATPKNNWRFDAWSDACASAMTSTCALTPAADASVRARFEMDDDDAL